MAIKYRFIDMNYPYSSCICFLAAALLFEDFIYRRTSLHTFDNFISYFTGNQFILEKVVDCPCLSCMYLHDYIMQLNSN